MRKTGGSEEKCREELEALIEQSSGLIASRGHIRFGSAVAYVRVGQRYVNGEVVKCIQLASVESRKQGKGHLSGLLEILESYDLPVYVECVLNPDLEIILERKGYEKIPGAEFDVNMIKWCGEKVELKP